MKTLASRHAAALCLALLVLSNCMLSGCARSHFPNVPPGYREFAYVSNGAANTVSVLDLVYLRQDRTLQVGSHPTGVAVNPRRDEVYVVNSASDVRGAAGVGSLSILSTDSNSVVATVPLHRQPYFVSVDPTGHRAYVANSGSNSVSVVDLDARRELGVVGAGEQPGLARISPDGRSLVVSNRGSGSVSVFAVQPWQERPKGLAVLAPHARRSVPTAGLPTLRAVFSGCPGATDIAILPDSQKAFVACSSAHLVMALSLAAEPGSWQAKQDPDRLADHLLALLEVGDTPVQLALKPDGGQVFCANFGSNSISAIDTQSNEVSRTDTIASRPVFSIVGEDNTLWIANFGSDSINLWSIDDGQLEPFSVRTGRAPDTLAFSADQHLLLAADSQSGDVAVIRTVDKNGPALFTILPAGGSPNDIAVKAMTGH